MGFMVSLSLVMERCSFGIASMLPGEWASCLIPRSPLGKEKVTVRLVQVETNEQRQAVKELVWEYLQWLNAMLEREYGTSLDIHSMLAQTVAELDNFAPPAGQVLLVEYEGQMAGVGYLRQIARDVGEIKRMYVRPAFRGKGLGRALLDGIIAEARQMGYPTLRLDSARFMKAAHSLYRSAGFREIAPYPGSEVPTEFQAYAIFMELPLE
jgi:GNAT superfamily N-acetyltransferase